MAKYTRISAVRLQRDSHSRSKITGAVAAGVEYLIMERRCSSEQVAGYLQY